MYLFPPSDSFKKRVVKLEKVVDVHGTDLCVLDEMIGSLQDKMNPQGAALPIGVVPVPKDNEKPSFYYHDPYRISEVDLSAQSMTAQGENLRTLLVQNTARFVIYPDGGTVTSSTGLNVHSNIWLFNKHPFKCETGRMDYIVDDVSMNVSRNTLSMRYCGSQFKNIGPDAVLVQLPSLPPGRSVKAYFPKNNTLLPGVHKGEYFLINRSGTRNVKKLDNIHAGVEPAFKVPGYLACVGIDTAAGDCGSPCLAFIGRSQVILGIHTSGNFLGVVAMQHVSQEQIDSGLASFSSQVEAGFVPISAPGYERKIVNLHAKSTFRWVPKGTANIVGSFAGYRPKNSSHVTRTFIHPFVKDQYRDTFTSPDMSWKPWSIAAADMVGPHLNVDPDRLKRCEDAFVDDLLGGLGDKLRILQVYTQEVALNGVAGVTYVDRINTSTSAGAPFRCSKKNFLIIDSDDKITGVTAEMQERINQVEECYAAGRRFNPVYTGTLKDEPVTEAKAKLGKTRVFASGEMAHSVVVRRFLLSHIKLIQENSFLFEAMPGVVAQSEDLRELCQYVCKFGVNRLIAGDYKKFDKKMIALFVLSAFNILKRLAERAGWSAEELRVIDCIAQDTAHFWFDMNGDLVQLQGNPSGNPLTVIINCLVNSLYVRYAYDILVKDNLRNFKKDVALATYGDDNIMGVREGVNFDHTRLMVALRTIGVEYTMADKESVSVPFVHIKDISFLKRKFVVDAGTGHVMAPLEHESFDKMLTTCVRTNKDVLCLEAHSINVIETALREYYFYGQEKFNERRNYFFDIVKRAGIECYVKDSTFPTFAEIDKDYVHRSNMIMTTWTSERRERLRCTPVLH